MAAIIRLKSLLNIRSALTNSNILRQISTSPKKSDAAAISQENCESPPAAAAATNKNWVSYGFEYKDQKSDVDSMNASFFFSVTLCLVFGTLVWSYLPDPQMRDWAQREGYLELRRREAAGLEPISRDYVNPSTIQLPSDEELGNMEIII